MKRSRWRVLVGALAAWCAAGGAHAQPGLSPEDLYERLAPSIWLVVVDLGNGAMSQGSAVVVAHGTVVTNCHVIDNAKAILVLHERVRRPARLQYRDPTRDLCQLQVPGLDAPAVRMVGGAGLRVGAKVYAIGSPRGLELTLSDGLVSGLRRNADGTLERIQVSVPISPGSSGGGLFDEEGRLVGITTSGLRDSQNLNFALPADWITELAPRAGGVAALRLEPRTTKSLQVAAAPSVIPPPPAPAAASPAIRSPASAPVAMPPTVAPASRPPAVVTEVPPASTALVEGRIFEYRVTERISGTSRTALLQVDRITGEEVIFNGGLRVENLRGEVLRHTNAVAGDVDAAMPPGGWVRPGTVPGASWRTAYRNKLSQQDIGMDIRIRALQEEDLVIAGHTLRVLRVEIQGYTTRGPTVGGGDASGSYRAIAWYAPQLGRIVRFDAKSRGGMGGARFTIDETAELVAIR